jgi:GWxTD domain-containing protein
MKITKIGVIGLLLVLFCLSIPAQKTKKLRVKDLPPKYRLWLGEEVTYIITPFEKNVFLQLETDREREAFIKAFWKNRDPNLTTVENEFKIEHYRRFKYANEILGKGTPTAGWRTDMGRIYILLGEPNQIQRYENTQELYPIIVWFYQGKVNLGLPNAFSVMFFKQYGAGDYIIYSPFTHGPNSLMIHYMGDVNDISAALRKLTYIEPAIASISLSLIEGEQAVNYRPSVASEILITKKITEVPVKRVDEDYAKKMLKYRGQVDVDYSANYIKSRSMVNVIQDRRGDFYVHYLIEPGKLSIERTGDTLQTILNLTGNVVDQKGQSIYKFDKKVPIRVSVDRLGNIGNKTFSFQDIFPMIAGEYTLKLLLKNAASKEFTSVEKKFTIPKIEKAQIITFFLANRIKKNPALLNTTKAYLIGDTQLVPSVKNNFTKTDTMYIYMQLSGVTDTMRSGAKINYSVYTIEDSKNPVIKKEKLLTQFADSNNPLESISLASLSPDYYNIEVTIRDKNKKLIGRKETIFSISPLRSLPRPWIVSLSFASEAPEKLNIIGNQLKNKGELKKSLAYLEKAYHQKPLSQKLALDYSNILFKMRQYQKAINICQPFMEKEGQHVFYGILGFSHQAMGHHTEAISFFTKYLTYYGSNFNVLNALGQSHYKSGNNQAAIKAWELSLNVEPNQERLKKVLKSIKLQESQKKSTAGQKKK